MGSINEILSYTPLTEAVQTIKGGIPRVLPEGFWSLTEDIMGTKARLIEFVGQRQVASVTPNGSPPVPRGKLTLDDKALILLSSMEEMEFSEELLNVLQQWEEYKPQQAWAERQVAYQGEGFRQLFENLETGSVYQNVVSGINYFDGTGQLLPSSSGAVLTVDQGVPANNKGQLNGLLTASFATSTTDILGFLTQLLPQRALGDTGYIPKIAIYGANIPGYINANEGVKRAWAYQSEFAGFFQNTGQIKPGWAGYQWYPGAQMFFQDSSGTNQFTFPADQITFLPELTKATYTFYRGSTKIPTQFGPLPSGDAALKSFSEITGRGRYAYIPQGGKFTIIDVGFTKFLSRFKVPNACYFLDTTP